ncbi:hypothetical protein DL96DRAFT_1827190 [Flagelloscypha sp. PMI_526]|nr:hypothetical protein DL96DRAFT_1827190 [Flagelloscypha sp. PMI_526]
MNVKVGEMFDIIGGAGVGGFCAILFTALDMTIGQVVQYHNILPQQVFASQYWARNDRKRCSHVLDEMQSQTGVSAHSGSDFSSKTSIKPIRNDHSSQLRASRSCRIRAAPSPRYSLRQLLHTILAD